MSVENIDRIRRQSETIELTEINQGILELSRTINEAKWSTQPRIPLELAIVKAFFCVCWTCPIMGITCRTYDIVRTCRFSGILRKAGRIAFAECNVREPC